MWVEALISSIARETATAIRYDYAISASIPCLCNRPSQYTKAAGGYRNARVSTIVVFRCIVSIPRAVNDGLGLDFHYEGLWQFGTFGSGNIRAWTAASETVYRFPSVRLKPRFSVQADISNGDSPTSKTLGTFKPLFSKGNYVGVLATTGPDPISFIDFHPHVETTFPHNDAASKALETIVSVRQKGAMS